MSVTIYHNPKCSKSRETLAILREHGITPTIIEYLKSPPSPETLKKILTLLEVSPRNLMRRKELAYAENKLDNPSLSDERLIDFMVNNPILIERPIVLANGKAVLGRPPSQVLAIID
ncbi:MAG: arsenate reductase (glutaredoxin) [Nitrospinaceae bacterium]|jgi:arsenate reductase